MTPRDLIAAFDALADAPDGVARLRELVLQLAVRGKLVPQDPADEPAGVLLARIAAEKKRLVREKKIRKPKPLPPIGDDEVPFEVPDGWVLTRLGQEALVIMGNSPKGTSYNDHGDGVPLINGPVEFSKKPLGPTVMSKYTTEPKQMCAVGDLIVCVRGATTGRTNVAAFSACIGRGVALVRAWDAQKYVDLFMWQVGNELLAAGKGTIFPSISYSDLAGRPVAIPPLAEQHRIVARVDELMALLDRLEAARSARETTRAALRDAALAALRDADDADAVELAWARVAEQMADLFTDPADVAPLRQTILQLAVRGRLAPQDPADEPASALLARIAAEKKRLVKAKLIRKPKPLPPIADDEVPFAVPEGWAWCRVDDAFAVAGGIQKSGKRRPVKNSYPYLRVANVQRGSLQLGEIKEFELFDGELEKYRLQVGDLLIVEGNGSETEIGRGARWTGEIEDCVHQNHLIRCRPMVAGHEYFVLRYLNAPTGTEIMTRLAVTTSGLYSLSVSKIRRIPIPIPPLAEQRRIVARVDALMSLCDALEARLTAAREARAAFAAAAVHHLDA